MTAVAMHQLSALCYAAAIWLQSPCTNLVHCVTQQLY